MVGLRQPDPSPSPPRHRRRWTVLEREFFCERRGDMSDAALARRLGRSELAMVEMGKVLGVPAKANWLTATQAGAILGRDRKTVLALGRRGVLHLRRSIVYAGRTRVWRCDIRELERFLREEPAAYDARRITEEPWKQIARKAHAELRPR